MDTTNPHPILKVEHLSMKFGGLIAIGDLSFEAKRGEITALIGPNGAGKTTVFNCITGFYKPSEGMITLTGKEDRQFLLERMPDYQITAHAKVARTFQNIRLFSGMTLLENLLVAQHNALMKASGFTVLGLLGVGNYRKASRESVELAQFWLEKANLLDRADDPAGDLPYGAQRRLEIARAMCTGPELLCLDEPAAGLNPRESMALNALLNDIKDSTGTSILLIEHDMSVVMQISDHVVVLEYGRKISDGNPGEVKNDPRVIAAYLGVDDEEISDVLSEVGDEHVIQELDVEPDRAHGPSASSSMMAGAVSDTIGHADPRGEFVKVSPGASRAAQSDEHTRREAATKAAAAEKAAATKPAAKKSATTAKKTESPKARSEKTAGKAMAKNRPAAIAAIPSKPAAKRPEKAAPQASSTRPATAKTAPPTRAAAGSKATAPIVKKAVDKPAAPAATRKISNTLPAPRGGKPDDLLLIKGIGPVNAKKLNEHGIFHFDQIAAWKKADVAAAEAYLAFDGRIAREDWIGQAKVLAKAPAEAPKRGGRK